MYFNTKTNFKFDLREYNISTLPVRKIEMANNSNVMNS